MQLSESARNRSWTPLRDGNPKRLFNGKLENGFLKGVWFYCRFIPFGLKKPWFLHKAEINSSSKSFQFQVQVHFSYNVQT